MNINFFIKYFVYLRLINVQKRTAGKEDFGADAVTAKEDYVPTPEVQRATKAFLITMAIMVVYGIVTKGGASFVILVMLTAAVVTGIAAKMKPAEIFDAITEGMGKMIWLYLMFVLFNPFLNFVTESGAFDALLELLKPLIAAAGPVVFTLLTVLVGIFGINGAATAQALIIHELFGPFLSTVGIGMPLWGMIVLIGHQITSFAYPGVDNMGAMGLAHAKSIKPMMQLGYMAIIPSTILLACITAALFG